MTHCYLRAMSPIHIQCKYDHGIYHDDYGALLSLDLANMGVRSSMSIVQYSCITLTPLIFIIFLTSVCYFIWYLVGFNQLSFLWFDWDASVVSRETNAPAAK